MEKIDIFFRKHSWLFKLGIWTLLIFWAAQGNYPFKFILADIQKDNISNISYTEALTARRANIKLSNEILRKAQEKGSDYSPRDYFVDLERLRVSEKKFNDVIISSCHPYTINTLMEICKGNMWHKGKYTMEDFSIAYKEYADRAGIEPPEQIKIDWLNLTKKVWGWFFTFYTRGFLLAFLLFLVLMSERDGILKIILSDKHKFILAVCFWPFFLHKYPANIVREIVVEAELRRIGSIFRRFTWEEKNKVRDIAKREDYRDWIDGFRLANTGLLRPVSFVLIPTIILYFFLPPLSCNSAFAKARDGTIISTCDMTADTTTNMSSLQDIKNFPNLPVKAIHIAHELIFKPVLVVSFYGLDREDHPLMEESRKIEHIPIYAPLFPYR